MTIPDKETFNRLSQAGKLGNFLQTWNYIDSALASGVWWFTIQSTEKQSHHFLPVVEKCCLRDMAAALIDMGAPRDEMYFREIPDPGLNRVIQFEAMLGPGWHGDGAGVELFYELDTTNPVRGIRERCQTATGLMSQSLLRTKLSPVSYDTLMELWETYPTAIVEFTEFSAPVGAFHQPGVFWEVRDY